MRTYFRWMRENGKGGYHDTGTNQTYAEFGTAGDAEDMLVACGFVERAIEEKWVLVLFTMNPVPVDFKNLPYYS